MQEPITKFTRQLYNTQDFLLHLAKDTLLDTSTHSTRQQAYTSFMVAPQKKNLAQAQWMTVEVMHQMFPHIIMEVGTLPNLNREELCQVGHLGEPPPRLHNSANYVLPRLGIDVLEIITCK